jgi:hypothetical protein
MRQKGLSTEVSARTGNDVDFGLRFSLASYRAGMLVKRHADHSNEPQ